MWDTNVPVTLLRGRNPLVTARVAAAQPLTICTSVIVYGELLHGAAKSARSEEGTRLVREILRDIPILALNENVAQTFGRLRADFERRGETIGVNDTWIAAHALSEELILVTNNEREFARVPNLKIENWTK